MVEAAEPAAGVQLRLLGPLELLIRGRAVTTGGPRQRALLAVLGLSAGTAVAPSRLVDLLWDEAPPPAATNTVQVYVSRLRRLFATAGAGSPLRSVNGMYLLDLPSEGLDVRRFEALGERGRTLLAAGDAAGAARELRLALGLWRGTPLPDLDTTVIGRATVARLESMRMAAVGDRIDAEAALGRHLTLIPELEGLVLRHPLDERFVGQLMTALYRAGRQAEAFAAYTAAAHRLADELGVDPGPALRALHTRMLRQDPALEPPVPAVPTLPSVPPAGGPAASAAPAGPSGAVGAVGAVGRLPAARTPGPGPGGPSRTAAGPGVPAPSRPGPAASRPAPPAVAGPGAVPGAPRVPPPALPPTVERVPEPLISASLVGRRAELATALELVRRPDVRLVTVLGAGGSGKSRLAAEVASVLAARAAGPAAEPGAADGTDRGPGGAGADPMLVAYVPLGAVDDAAQVPAEICRALRAEPDWAGEPATDVAIRALGDGPALVVLDNLEQLVDGGLQPVRELIERTRRLTVLGTSRTVLGLPGERLLPLGPLPLPPAPPVADPAAVTASEAVQLFRERARAVLPAFEVTAGNADAVAALCRGLDGLPLALELAAARVRVLPPEEILTRLDRRLELLAGGAPHLPERQRSMWAALDWSARLLDAPERRLFGQLAVFAGGWTLDAAEAVCGRPGADDMDVVDVLSRLVDKSLVVADGTGRLGMLQTVRDYAREVLAGEPVLAAATRARHASFYAGLAEELGPQVRGWTAASGPSPRTRLEAEAGNLTLALEQAAGDPATGRPVDGELLGRLVTGLLDHWFAAGRLREVNRWLRAARQAPMSPALRARMLLSFGNLAVVGGNPAQAVDALGEACEVAERLGDTVLLVRARAARAVAARYLGRPREALALLTGALETLGAGRPDGPGGSGDFGDSGGHGDFGGFGGPAGPGGRGADDPLYALAGFDLADTLDGPLGPGPAGAAATGPGPVDDDATAGLVRALENEVGEVLDELGRTGEAVTRWRECRRWAETTGNPVQLAYPLVNLAREALERGAADEAQALTAQALAAAVASESAPVLADVVAAAGLVDLRTGRRGRAQTRLREAVRLGHDCGQLLSMPETVAVLGAATCRSEPAVAARLLGAARAWRSARSITVGRGARAVVAQAEAELASAPAAGGAGRIERDRGARTPFGSLRGLSMLDPELLDPPRPPEVTVDAAEPAVIDLRADVLRG